MLRLQTFVASKKGARHSKDAWRICVARYAVRRGATERNSSELFTGRASVRIALSLAHESVALAVDRHDVDRVFRIVLELLP